MEALSGTGLARPWPDGDRTRHTGHRRGEIGGLTSPGSNLSMPPNCPKAGPSHGPRSACWPQPTLHRGPQCQSELFVWTEMPAPIFTKLMHLRSESVHQQPSRPMPNTPHLAIDVTIRGLTETVIESPTLLNQSAK